MLLGNYHLLTMIHPFQRKDKTAPDQTSQDWYYIQCFAGQIEMIVTASFLKSK